MPVLDWSTAMPPFRRMMVFVDGENLVTNYEKMLQNSSVPRADISLMHEPGVYVWAPGYVGLVFQHEVLRVRYYAACGGDDSDRRRTLQALSILEFKKHDNATLAATLSPSVFARQGTAREGGRSRASKQLHVTLVTEVMGHTCRDHLDTVYLISGDGDLLPLVDEVKKRGKTVYVSAFSRGLDKDLMLAADRFWALDPGTFDGI